MTGANYGHDFNPRYPMALIGTLQGHSESGLESTFICVINGLKTVRILEKQIQTPSHFSQKSFFVFTLGPELSLSG